MEAECKCAQRSKREFQALCFDLLMSLVINGYSESQLMTSLRELGLPYSVTELAKIKEQLLERLNDFKRRELPKEVFTLFINGYHTEIKDNLKVRKSCVYTVLGVDLEGKKDVYQRTLKKAKVVLTVSARNISVNILHL